MSAYEFRYAANGTVLSALAGIPSPGTVLRGVRREQEVDSSGAGYRSIGRRPDSLRSLRTPLRTEI
jgi:hypothetical protein